MLSLCVRRLNSGMEFYLHASSLACCLLACNLCVRIRALSPGRRKFNSRDTCVEGRLFEESAALVCLRGFGFVSLKHHRV